ncbi:hypothetical protein EDB89DRAFT_173830 [Lactarius sanguifluus]|nr:hypothetical protein EDB89DRAFT_173830 [Lactarius sanguifluus]
MKTASSRGYRTSLVTTSISSAPRIASSETASPRPSTKASSRSSSTTLSTVYRNRGRRRPICTHEEAWQQCARSSPTGGGIRQPRDGRQTQAALRGGSSERSDALAPAYGAASAQVGAQARTSRMSHEFWSSRRHRRMEAVQGKGKGKAGRKIRPQNS